MKPLVLAVLSLLVFSAAPLRAQVVKAETSDSLEALKKKYAKGQKPEAVPGVPEVGAPMAREVSIADIEELLLRMPGCKKNPDDTKDLAANLKGKYGVISCSSKIDGLKQFILVPKSAQTPDQQLAYVSQGGYKLLRARFVDHYLVLLFDKQVQYLDLLKQGNDDRGQASGFALAGFVADKRAERFEDMLLFVDALKNYMGIADGSADAGAFTAVPQRVTAAIGANPRRLTGAFVKDSLVVTVTSGGDMFTVWPEKKN